MKRSIFALGLILGLISHVPASEAQRAEPPPTTEWGKEELRRRQEHVARQVRSAEAGLLLCEQSNLPIDSRPPLAPEVQKNMYECTRAVRDAHCWTTPPVNDAALCSRLNNLVESWMTIEQRREKYRKEREAIEERIRQNRRTSSEDSDQEFPASSEATEEESQLLFEALELLELRELEALGEGLE